MNTTVKIDTADDLSTLVHQCTEGVRPIVDYGVAHDGLGYPPPANSLKLVQTGTVIEHYERDMTVRAAAGTSLADLHAQMSSRNQFFPVDADPDLTLGEVIQHNVYGPLRLTYGASRDLLLGLRYVDGRGRQIHVGGRTVKNVAGYDVTRFLVGSLGELGLIYEATVRTYAIPDRVLCVELQLEDPSELDAMLSDWLKTDAAPTWLLLNLDNRQATLKLGYFGRGTSCEVQHHALESLLANHSKIRILGISERSLDQDTADRSRGRRWRREAAGLCKLVVPPATTGATCQALAEWSAEHAQIHVDALPTHGCIFTGGTIDVDTARQLDARINGLVEAAGGLRVWHRRPNQAEQIAPFGPPQSDFAIVKKLKQWMDPHGLFNPGRYLPAKVDDL